MRFAAFLASVFLVACTPRALDVPFDLPPDLTVVDLSVPPDFTPPSDLVPPKYCDGIFVFDEENRLSFFDPIALVFHDIAILSCPTAPGDSPFSMAVARDGTAWVEYTSGDLFNVDTTTGACTATAFSPSGQAFSDFGMGFAANAAGSSSETLFLAANSNFVAQQPRLGKLDLTTLDVTPIGNLPGAAELTGTGSGELWGLFASASPHFGQINKSTAAIAPDFTLAQLGDLSQDAFAFGNYAGSFYAFFGVDTTTVYRLSAVDGSATVVVPDAGRLVVGAGVSTCAPGGDM